MAFSLEYTFERNRFDIAKRRFYHRFAVSNNTRFMMLQIQTINGSNRRTIVDFMRVSANQQVHIISFANKENQNKSTATKMILYSPTFNHTKKTAR